jgi:hypothetical protein
MAVQAWSVPWTSGQTGPIWFYEEAPGYWRGDGSARLEWGNSAAGATLTVRDAGRRLRIGYPGSSPQAQSNLCEGGRAPLRWFSGRG